MLTGKVPMQALPMKVDLMDSQEGYVVCRALITILDLQRIFGPLIPISARGGAIAYGTPSRKYL